jgi:hypothetical protein
LSPGIITRTLWYILMWNSWDMVKVNTSSKTQGVTWTHILNDKKKGINTILLKSRIFNYFQTMG